MPVMVREAPAVLVIVLVIETEVVFIDWPPKARVAGLAVKSCAPTLTIWLSGVELLALYVELPEYMPTMELAPGGNPLVMHVAAPDVRATETHPAMFTPPFWKVTV